MAQLEALEQRRNISIQHARFNAALVASALINVHRSAESTAVSPFDFMPGFETDPEQEERDKLRRSIKHAIALAFTEMEGKSPEEVQAEKVLMVARMRDNGVADPEELIREVFPDL